ncbi:MAG: RNA polymerase sigma factor [Alphaproteobacteria bacterium]|nr:RNA polymerase sigma factor [Alphaproteobacteria bacterium]MCB9691950.1 RNA polymerase sigma factor [Alphaproteobacteria bacterium]
MTNVVPFPTPPRQAEELDLGALFDAHGAWLLRVTERLCGRRDLAEDLVQEIFLVAWKRRHEIEDMQGIRTWLYRVAVNVVRHRHRSENRYGNVLARFKHLLWGTTSGADVSLERYQRGQQVHDIIAKLSPKQREVFVLYELEELEGAEIAAILDISVNTVWSRLRLARAAFKTHWEEVSP